MSYLFDASGQRIAGDFGSTTLKPFTIVAWVKRTNAQWLDADNVTFVDLNDDLVDLNSQHLIGNNTAAQRIGCRAREEADGSFHQSNCTFGDTRYDDIWVTAIGVFRSDANRQAYAEAATLVGNLPTNSDPTNPMQYISIGNDAHGGGFNWAKGKVAEVAIFDKDLTVAEIEALQTGEGAGPAPNTVASANCIGYWPLLDNQSSHPDQSGNGGPTLTVEGSPTWEADHPDIGPIGTVNTRTLSDSAIIYDPVDKFILTAERPANSNIDTLSDSIETHLTHGRDAIDSISFSESLTSQHDLDRQLFNELSLNDVLLFIREKHLQSSDSLDAIDGLTRNITIGDTSETFFRIRKDTLQVTDSVIPTFLGIVQKIAAETIYLNEYEFVRRFVARPVTEQVAIVSDLLNLTNYKLRKDSVKMRDDLIVTRAPINRTRILTDSFSARDYLGDVDTGTFLKPPVPIETGIEER
jgi:hypothetical protein